MARSAAGVRSARRLLAVVLGVAIGAGAGEAAGLSEETVVQTREGAVRGVVRRAHREFLGIPYARPPVGRDRWRAPAPAAPWRGVRDATHLGSVCPQLARGADGGWAALGDEDCLSLNVYVPRGTSPRRSLPVMVWFHGGSFVEGSGGLYDPSRLVELGDVVVITVNYRLGALGFLARSVPDAGERPSSGAYGIEDQQLALAWTRRNVGAFGGDPWNVTLVGQSAGAYSVCAHLAAPASQALFEKAIIESGPCANPLPSIDTAREIGDQVVAAVGCASAGDAGACLRQTPVEVLLAAQQAALEGVAAADSVVMPFFPPAGTATLPFQPGAALRAGLFHAVPLLVGSTHDEMRLQVALNFDAQGAAVTPDMYPALLQVNFGVHAAEVLARYPLERYPSPSLALATALTDSGRLVGACPTHQLARWASSRVPVYAYELDEAVFGQIGDFPLGAAHGSELPFLFDGFEGVQLDPGQHRLAERVVGYWAQFARSGNPNRPALPEWPPFAAGAKVQRLSSAAVAPTDRFRADHQCAFWDSLPR